MRISRLLSLMNNCRMDLLDSMVKSKKDMGHLVVKLDYHNLMQDSQMMDLSALINIQNVMEIIEIPIILLIKICFTALLFVRFPYFAVKKLHKLYCLIPTKIL